MSFQSDFADAKKRVEAVTYFAHCGHPFTDMLPTASRQVESWATAQQACEETLWEATQIEARNVLTSHLSLHHREDYRQWNVLSKQAREDLRAQVFPRIKDFVQQNGLSTTVANRVQWDLLHYCMKEAYQSLGVPLRFFRELFCVYESGHLPCGWEHEEWPRGRLLIY